MADVVSLARDTPTVRYQCLYQILSKYVKGIKVMERTRFWLQGMKKKLRVVSLAYDMPTGPPLHLYLISQYYLKQYGSYGLHKISASGETTT